MSVHNTAQKGFGTGTNELYDRIRPSYQSDALEHILESVKNKDKLDIVEIGAGTGIFTRALLANQEWNAKVGSLRAFDPSEGMRDEFKKTVLDPRVSIAEGTFQSVDVSDGWADIVIIAQAFHWAHPHYGPAVAEFARVLKPNGTLCLIWNLEDRDNARWVAQLRDAYEKYEHGTPQFRLNWWKATFDTDEYKKLFASPEEQKWEYHLIGSDEIVIDRALSKSYVAVLDDEEKEKFKAEVKTILDRGDDKRWIDKANGQWEYPYKTFVVLAKKA